MIVGRPFGTPPLVISSNPAIPVRAFSNCGNTRESPLRRDLDVAKELNLPVAVLKPIPATHWANERRDKTLIIHDSFQIAREQRKKNLLLSFNYDKQPTGNTVWTETSCRTHQRQWSGARMS
jgi:hypothetical protein